MKLRGFDIFAMGMFYIGMPIGWLFAPVVPAYWPIYITLLALYVWHMVVRWKRWKNRRREFVTFDIREEQRKEDAA